MAESALPRPSALPWLGVSAVLIALDQWTKWLAVEHLTYQDPVAVVPGFWNWMLTHNTGAAFSFLAQADGWQHTLFIALALAISGFLSWLLARTRLADWRTALPFAMIIAGALGNVIDRFRLGYVIDFVQWYVHDFYWPVFNLADSCIVVGAVLMVLFSMGGREER